MMAFCDPLAEDQAEAGAGEVSVERAGDAGKALEDSGLVLFRDPDACVGYPDFGYADFGGTGAGGLTRRAKCQCDRSSGRGVSPGVFEQDVEQTFERYEVGIGPEFG